jgi:hypothetical protein
LRLGAFAARRGSTALLAGAAGECRHADDEQREKLGTPTTSLMIHPFFSHVAESPKAAKRNHSRYHQAPSEQRAIDRGDE